MNLVIQQALFTAFRPVFILILAILIVFFFLSLLKDSERRGITFGFVLTISVILMLIAVMTFFVESQLVDTYTLSPDRATLYLFMGSLILGVANPLVYKIRNKASSRSRSRYRYRR